MQDLNLHTNLDLTCDLLIYTAANSEEAECGRTTCLADTAANEKRQSCGRAKRTTLPVILYAETEKEPKENYYLPFTKRIKRGIIAVVRKGVNSCLTEL